MSPCDCPVCDGLAPEEERATVGCKFVDVDQQTTYLHNTYMKYVEYGNTPLTDLPYFMSEVAEIVLSAKWEGKHKRMKEEQEQRKEHQRSQHLIRQAQQKAIQQGT